MSFTNPCGGRRWETLPDGTIAVEGEGTPSFDPASRQFQWMTQCWQNWSGLILDGAARNDIPPQWILAIMLQESGAWSDDPERQATIVSFDGGVGLMQITDKSLGDPQDMLDPATNVATGSAFLGRLSRQRNGELPEVAASYNAGSVKCGSAGNPWGMVMTGDYVGNVIRWNNTALMYLSLRRPHMVLGLSLAAAGLYAALAMLGYAPVPRILRRYV